MSTPAHEPAKFTLPNGNTLVYRSDQDGESYRILNKDGDVVRPWRSCQSFQIEEIGITYTVLVCRNATRVICDGKIMDEECVLQDLDAEAQEIAAALQFGGGNGLASTLGNETRLASRDPYLVAQDYEEMDGGFSVYGE